MKSYATPECAPIIINNGSRQACLCLHGLCASPATFVPYTDTISAAGYDVYAPLLPGHGTRYQDMLQADAADFLSAATEAFDRLAAQYDKVHLFGFSLGGALSAYLAGHYGGTGRVGKVLLLSPGFALRDKKFYDVDYSKAGEEKWPLTQQANEDAALQASAFVYEYMYLRSVGQLLQLEGPCQGSLENITSPVWLAYGVNDPVADPDVIAAAAARIKDMRQLLRLENSGHNILLDNDREQVLECLDAFLRA